MKRSLMTFLVLSASVIGCAKSATVRPDEPVAQNPAPTPAENAPESVKVAESTTPAEEKTARANGESASVSPALSASVVYFEYDADTLSAAARAELATLVEHIRMTGHGGSIVLEGHADERGTEEYNLALGDRRANAVRRYLEQLGLRASQLKTVSYGENRPAVQGSDESAWSKNRRVEIVPPTTTASLK